jgi:hypothetical protein
MVVVPDDKLEAAITAIGDAARTGEIGDGTIFVSPVEMAIRIRTGDRDGTALYFSTPRSGRITPTDPGACPDPSLRRRVF